MTTVTLTDHAAMLCMLAEHQNTLDEAVDTATLEYLRAQEYARAKLQNLREAIDKRDAMQIAREFVRNS